MAMSATTTQPKAPLRADSSTAISPGYKQTEVGVIPEDWEAKRIGDVVSFSGGTQPPRSTFVFAPKEGYVRLIQIRDYKTDEFATFVSEASAVKRCTARDVMIGRYGPPIFQILRGIEGAYNVALIKSIPSPQIDLDYWYYFVAQDRLFQLIDSLSRRSSGQTGVEMSSLKSFGLPLPPQAEQRAIAGVLSDVDELIGALEKLIAKKQSIKQGAMQQLLTGKTRLPGFRGAWETRRLGDISHIKTGSLNNEDKIDDGVYPFFVRSAAIERINSFSFEDEAILIPGEGGIGSIFHYIDGRHDVHQRVYRISRFSENMCGKFVYYSMILHFGRHAMQNTVKATVDSLRLPTFQSFGFPAPKSFVEQQAISTVLSDMDAEIAVLERGLAKTRDIKQGMMQQLLTGRIRLVKVKEGV